MNKKILELLKTKYKDLGLSESILKVTADRLARTVKEEAEEAEITQAIESVESELRIYQSFEDRNRTLLKEVKDLKEKLEKNEPNPTPNPNPEPKPNEGNPEPNPMLELLKELKGEITALKSEKIQQSNKEKLTAKLQELGVNENFYKLHIDGKTFENDEQINEFANQLKESQDAFAQSINNDLLKNQSNPLFGNRPVEGQVSADVQDYIKTKFNQNQN
ncbi:hypothetical protein [Riemerella anatipestifer]|uniref:Uncharacterized protein n=1 Tax=Riemerella anatipestifer (strain ATCC 11845 / DSM 15868 / JCM 9532 / NCTC 11014) TaxID=693978 RepID=E4TE83_RIEAD|nr:hypothetical protein [Riemerella anatipestifer]ADQ83092.1 hypothetical protein Riean_1939 [Riemerella anatipestifer ATCC 11845 = DSM 15868]AFD55154.1 hypothetical protein RA0C_0139 [Riemerella anatipestifer ATCC 11845 = DSM 15868]MRM93204.1 hypothetical protein [Riemerella anatipestifer]SNV79162.1 Uncharacterised protein [Riemerella anatipestifer]